MLQHKLFHFAIEDAAPVRSGQERPTNLYLSFGLVIAMEARRPNNLAVFRINDQKSSSRGQCSVKKLGETIYFVAILTWMLLPNEWIRSDGVKV